MYTDKPYKLQLSLNLNLSTRRQSLELLSQWFISKDQQGSVSLYLSSNTLCLCVQRLQIAVQNSVEFDLSTRMKEFEITYGIFMQSDHYCHSNLSVYIMAIGMSLMTYKPFFFEQESHEHVQQPKDICSQSITLIARVLQS